MRKKSREKGRRKIEKGKLEGREGFLHRGKRKGKKKEGEIDEEEFG